MPAPAVSDLAVSSAYLRQLWAADLADRLSDLGAHHDYTLVHSERVARIAFEIGVELDLPGQELKELYRAALLHDIGKLEVPAEILAAERRLSGEEGRLVASHAEAGGRILAADPSLAGYAPVARFHHESYDGTGYPVGLASVEIPFHARIVCVADCFEAMTAEERRWRTPLTVAEATAEVVELAGRRYDPMVADAFARVYG